MAAAAAAAAPFLLLLLLAAGPAGANEGGASGSCRCRRVTSRPPFLDRLQSCDSCKDLTRFKFPNRQVCGLHEEEWVIEVRDYHCPKGLPPEARGEGTTPRAPPPLPPSLAGGLEAEDQRTDTREGHHLPAPTSPTTGPPPTSPSSAEASTGRSTEGPQAAEPQKEVAWVPAMVWNPPEPSAEMAVRRASEAPQEEKRAKTPGVTMAAICVACTAGLVVLGFCWRRRQRSWRAQTPRGGKEEGSACLPA